MKACNGCAEAKPLAEFPLHKRRGKVYTHSKCRACRRAQCRAWAKTPGGRQVKRAGILRRNYGLSEEQYRAQHDLQKGLCAICERPETKIVRGTLLRLSVDHDHATGDVRKLLCSACNVGLGSFKDDPDLLRRAAAYLGGEK